jgi:hypothetical protein
MTDSKRYDTRPFAGRLFDRTSIDWCIYSCMVEVNVFRVQSLCISGITPSTLRISARPPYIAIRLASARDSPHTDSHAFHPAIPR